MVLEEEIAAVVDKHTWMTIDLPVDRPLTELEKAVETYLLTTFDFYEYARSLQEAKRLEANKEVYFEELYEEISCKTFAWGDNEGFKDFSTFGQALRIIEAKEAYERRIKKLKRQYSKWRQSLYTLNSHERRIMRVYFEGGRVVLDGEIYDLIEHLKRKVDHTVFKN